jgi:hypothetical protein
MNPTNMLELQQFVLDKVNEDQYLFEKELRKSLLWLTKEELIKLYGWVIDKFNDKYEYVIHEVFNNAKEMNLLSHEEP